ncbi:hypothetical protein [Curtobacterium sp. MCJR17_020]|uniref:hypothetical protein n=1 Tax=Curtobacterium sp. MCJR17_020 TaxID=2175619 RepID=UPI000DA96D2A|nr:hypothetical protein [Curtobacterium sp. MCJR17_020]WIE70797.1 hypothetical protein DEJ14_011320 [Curtobacterium sp. MCJR17_020]
MPATNAPVLDGLDRIFDLEPEAWAPRTAIYRVAAAALPDTARPFTSRELFDLLRTRGFREAKRRGVRGFVGIRVPDDVATLPALVPEHSASSYRHRGDRSEAAKRAVALSGRWQTELRGSRTRDRFAPTSDLGAELDRKVLTDELAPLRREARDLEHMIAQTFGTDLPEQHHDACRLRLLRDRISELSAELRDL